MRSAPFVVSLHSLDSCCILRFRAKRLDRRLLVARCSAGVHREVAAVHGNDRAGDPFGRIRRQQHSESLDVAWPSQPSRRDTGEEAGFERRVLLHAGGQAGIDDLGRQDCVDSHATPAPFGAQLARHLYDRAHRHAVCDVSAAHRRQQPAAGRAPS